MEPSDEGILQPIDEGGLSKRQAVGILVFVVLVIAIVGITFSLYNTYQQQQATQRVSITPYQYLTTGSLSDRKISFLVRFVNPSDLPVEVMDGELMVSLEQISLGKAIDPGFSLEPKRTLTRQYEFPIPRSDLTALTEKGGDSLEARLTGFFRMSSEDQEFVRQFSFAGRVDVTTGNSELGLT
ncbi:MAG: hypothetical protein ACE5KG_06995 [Nitrososphaerales archaeon]